MESNVNEGEGTQSNESSPQITESMIEQRFKEDNVKCDHFSIRAYVAEIRKKDWKICWPFCSSVECKEPNDHEEFRCWYCQNFLSNSDASDAAANTLYEDKDCEENGDMSSCEYLPLIDLVRKEKISSIMSNTKIRPDVYAKSVDEGRSEPTCIRRKDIQFINEENVSRNAGGALNCGNLELEIGDRKMKCKRTCSNETYHQLPESESTESGSLDSQLSCHRKICSLKSNRNGQNKDTESVRGEQQSNKCYLSAKILKCKRPQKVRLLSDILRGGISGGSFDFSSSNGTLNSDNMDTRVIDTEAADDSDDLTLDTLFKNRKVSQPNKKRSPVEDTGPGQSGWSNGESEVSWSQNSNKDNNSVQSVIDSSTSVKTALSRDVGLVSRAEKKRKRKSSFEGRRSSSKMSQENSCQELLLVSTEPESKETQTGTGNCQVHLPNDALIGSSFVKPNVGESLDCDPKSISCVKEGRDKGSLIRPHEFVPMKKQNIEPYLSASNKRSDSPPLVKNKHGTFKTKKGATISCNYENNIVAQANSEVRESPSNEMTALDDISMEIVKLLAENRRERRLLEAETDRVCLSRSVNQVENPPKVQPTKAYDDVKSTDLRKSSFQVQRKPFRVGGDTFDETISSRKPIDVEIYSQKTAEKPCACVQKKIRMSPKLDASLTTNGYEPVPEMQLLRQMEAGMSCRKSHNAGLYKICDAHKKPSPVEKHKHHTFGEPMMNARVTKRNIDSTRIGETRGQVSGDIVSGTVKSCKKAKLKSSLAPLQSMNGRVNGDVSEKNSLGTGYQPFFFKKGQSSGLDYNVLSVEPNMAEKKKGAVGWAVKGGEICSVNRNPADFSIPGTGNKFMRRGKRSENSRKGHKRKPTIGKMAGSMTGIIPTCVA